MVFDGLYTKFINWFEKYLIFAVLGSFIIGIVGARYSQGFIDIVNSIIDGFMSGYDYLAPIAIFVILTPALTKSSICFLRLATVFLSSWVPCSSTLNLLSF